MDTRFLLAPDAYFGEEWYEREQEMLFARTWHLAAATDELAEPGDFVTIDAGHDPLVVVRGLDNELRAFHDFCPHRGIKLLVDRGNTRTGIVCPYHSWNFALDGALRNVPQPEEFDPVALEDCGLVAASVAEWGGMVFVNGAPDADFGAYLQGFADHIGSYRPEQLREVVRVQFDARCNWKLFVENHVDVYHLWYLHARSLSAYDHHQFEWDAIGPHWVSYEPAKAGVERRRPHVGSTPIAGLDERDRVGIGAHMLFPNTLFATESEFFMSYVAKPLAPDRSVIDVRMRAEPSADVEMLVAAAKEFMLEDVERVRRHPGNSAFEPFPRRPARTEPRTADHAVPREPDRRARSVMTLARQFVGAWQRRSIAIDGGAPTEPARVLWLQAGDAFADLRIPQSPGDEPDAFAGVTTYDEPALTWHHTLDWNGGFAGYDCGVVEWRDDDLIERGEFERDGRCHAYEEVWHRIDGGPVGLVLTATHAMVVRLGGHCLALRDRRRAGGRFDVRHAEVVGVDWTDVAVLGDGSELPRPPLVVPNYWTPGSTVSIDGATWRVAERWG